MYRTILLTLTLIACAGDSKSDTYRPYDTLPCAFLCETPTCGVLWACYDPADVNATDDFGDILSDSGAHHWECDGLYCLLSDELEAEVDATCGECITGTTSTVTCIGTNETGPPFGKGDGNGP